MLETLRISFKVAERHWLIYRKDFLANIAPTIVDPVMFILAFGFGLGAHIAQINGQDYVSYMGPGLTVSPALYTAFFEMGYNFYIRFTYEGVYQAMLTTPIGVRELIIGEYMWVAAKGAFMSLLVAIVLIAFKVVDPTYFLLIPLLGALVGICCGAIGLIANSLIRNINQFQTIYALLIAPMFFFSGIFYPLDSIPSSIRWLTYLSPLHHGVKLGQQILWGKIELGSFGLHLGSLTAMTLVLVSISYPRIYRKLRR